MDDGRNKSSRGAERIEYEDGEWSAARMRSTYHFPMKEFEIIFKMKYEFLFTFFYYLLPFNALPSDPTDPPTPPQQTHSLTHFVNHYILNMIISST